ncbi:hypothetical protein CDL15_Pgr026274 [Punica granatum]|uniref:Uncharacterized protein n=1 Tax=Punica granatum TaxID=22663 RepID=A0A218XX62_PUNGR|nr:hypothetical protein CDL15_Pgr026274 [Punica granatum]
MHGVTPFQELLSGLPPHTSIGKRLDVEVSITKLNAKAVELAICPQRNPQHQLAASPKQGTFIDFKSTHHPRGTHQKHGKTRLAMEIMKRRSPLMTTAYTRASPFNTH